MHTYTAACIGLYVSASTYKGVYVKRWDIYTVYMYYSNIKYLPIIIVFSFSLHRYSSSKANTTEMKAKDAFHMDQANVH